MDARPCTNVQAQNAGCKEVNARQRQRCSSRAEQVVDADERGDEKDVDIGGRDGVGLHVNGKVLCGQDGACAQNLQAPLLAHPLRGAWVDAA